MTLLPIPYINNSPDIVEKLYMNRPQHLMFIIFLSVRHMQNKSTNAVAGVEHKIQ